jgi:hypothetical protein
MPAGSRGLLIGWRGKNHPGITPFGYCLISWLSATLLKGTIVTSSSERHWEGGAMPIYQIRIKERLDQRWSAWFGGLTVTHEANGETALTGEVVDQAGLHGLLSKVRDLQLTLLSVYPLEADLPLERKAREENP